MKLYGKNWTRRELESRVGRIEQIGGIRKWRLSEGKEDGVEVIQVRTGAGLSYEVVPSKGLDISLAEYQGHAINWQSPNGNAHPSYYNAEGNGWLRTASGGLLMTCGLMQVGSPNTDDGEMLGLHGRIHHTPAKQVSAVTNWIGDELELTVSGVLEETEIFGGHLQLRRSIHSRLGSNEIVITDEVRNCGYTPCPHMILYHFNFGFPLMAEGTQIRFPEGELEARDRDVALDGLHGWQAPDALYRERVYYHQLKDQNTATVQIYNPEYPVNAGSFPVKVELSWLTETLPNLVQWRMPGAGTHVLGVEPANCRVEGRDSERKRGTLFILEPGQSVHYELKLSIQ